MFCKNCGTECGDDVTKCPKCGKRVRIKIQVKNLFLFTILILSIAGNLALGIIIGTQQGQIEAYGEKQQKLASELSLQKQYSYQDITSGAFQDDILSWSNTYQLIEEAYPENSVGQSMSSHQAHSMTFANKYVAIVTPTGTKWHRPYCHHIALATEISIYSQSGAELAGYEPCEDCRPMTYEELEQWRSKQH